MKSVSEERGVVVPVRQGREPDAEGMSRVHYEAIRGSAAGFYPAAVIESWAPPPSEERALQFRRAIAGNDELFMVAEHTEGVIGFGSIVLSNQELRALYVHPRFGRCGVGGAILEALEHLAVRNGLTGLHLTGSVNAERFYLRHGYELLGRSLHRTRSGVDMACVRMKKTF